MRNNLRDERDKRALKQWELAFMADCSITSISQIENNRMLPGKKLRQQLAKALKCEEEEIFPTPY